MATPTYTRTETWGPKERDGYEERRVVTYAPIRRTPGRTSGFDWLRVEEWFASLLAAGATGWSARVAALNFPNTDLLWQTPGPLEICGIALLIWLQAKWRRSVRVK